ncbi:STAS domain-containing protein [Desulfospira joergensenii]|uniref:STAS domain-containing protein n=1 Tax=Desulfospira joergensenii TaxID=53329 RepID=UPI0003B35615|nr:STAS domain-containing protein [Desulfospira joergensenii]
MTSPEKDKDGNLVIKIKGSLSAYEVGALKDQMLLGLENENGLILDINGITDCDTLGIQLLYSAGKTAKDLNKTFLLSGTSKVCREAAMGIGLEPEDYLNSLEEA